MFHRIIRVFVIVLLAALWVGCTADGEPQYPAIQSLRRIPANPQEKVETALQAGDADGEEPGTQPFVPSLAQLAAPKVQVRARFVSAESELIAQAFAADLGASGTTIARSRIEAAQERLAAETETCQLTAPRLTMYSDQRTRLSMETRRAFVHDVVCKPVDGGDRNSVDVDPVLDSVAEGVVLEVSGRADGEAVVLTHIAAKSIHVQGFRNCRLKVTDGDRRRTLLWQEAIFVEGTAPVDNPCAIRLGPDEVLVLPLVSMVRQTTGNARLLTGSANVQESLRLSPRHWPGLQTILLIEARQTPANGQALRGPSKVKEE
ncbi:MAG TPA: hypothetical protein VM389_10465 [Phycisphaerae bacterium]|nr:hypothetical protein [Phycisphaerae bacterium]